MKCVTLIWKINHLNPLRAELNTICHLLALLGAHHISHVSRIRVNFTISQYPIFVNTIMKLGQTLI